MSDEIKGLEQQKKNFQKLIDMRDLALRLTNNRDFRKLILDEFCGTESARLVHESGDPALKREDREDALAMAQAAGHLRRYLSMTIKLGDQAENTMGDLDDAIADARAQEDLQAEDQTGTLN